ncbi:hypothetical protein HID58_050041 [Brassica napus]|uniref:Uncharacterized protein n=1 Tax=Brassica napus TaxID=3708 RepID=A0ABQ8A503_BRANA|nr:hypothetical protein HID58_096212 [Brassica napus]KAH0887612.1 hypothetical protein HID58_050041 [Brassica napus]
MAVGCFNNLYTSAVDMGIDKAVDLLRASLVTSCALSTALGDLIAKTPKKEPPKDGTGFVKRGTKFTVSDYLIVTPKKSSSTFNLLKKLKIQADDLEVQVISISNAEALNLLRASLVTSSALSSAFRSLLVKEDRLNPISKRPKIET